MTTNVVPETEWTAAVLRPTAHWVPVRSTDGRTRMEMVWAVPTVTVPEAAPAA